MSLRQVSIESQCPAVVRCSRFVLAEEPMALRQREMILRALSVRRSPRGQASCDQREDPLRAPLVGGALANQAGNRATRLKAAISKFGLGQADEPSNGSVRCQGRLPRSPEFFVEIGPERLLKIS